MILRIIQNVSISQTTEKKGAVSLWQRIAMMEDSRSAERGPLDHYQPWDPKRVGFAAPQIGPLDLRQKYGFTRPVINASQYAQYTDPPSSGGYGYSPANLIVTIHYSNPAATVDGCPNVVDFYADEPYTNGGWGMQDIINVADYVHTRGKKFGVGEQGTLLMIPSTARTYFNEHVVSHLDFVTYTNYQNLYSGSGDNDQRPTWTTLRNNYGAKFDRVWISSVKDGFEYSSLGDEYSNLLGHASNLGINIALFYCGPGRDYQGAGTQRQLDSFCSAARAHGWLRKFVKEIEQHWCCETQVYNPDTCYLHDSIETGNIVEV